MEIEFGPSVEIIRKPHICVVVNPSNGTWTRIRTDLFESLENNVTLGYGSQRIVSEHNGKDQEILGKLLPQLFQAQILVPTGLGEAALKTNGNDSCQEHGTVSLMVTLKCNLKCRHCSIAAGPSVTGAHPSSADLYRMLHKIMAFDLDGLVITGGEPLIRQDIFDFLREVRRIFKGRVVLQTNGTLITPEKAQILAEQNLIDYADISLDGVDEASCAPIRGAGVFDRAIQGIKNLQAAGITKISTSCVITQDNSHLQHRFVELNQQLGTEHALRVFNPAGRGKENQAEFDIHWEDSIKAAEPILREKYGQLENENVKKWLRIKSRRGLMARTQCSAGKSTLAVMPDGDVYPCAVLIAPQFRMGNLLEDMTLAEILDDLANKQLLKSFNIDERPTCKDCDIRYFCIGGCMGENYERYGNALAPCQECMRYKRDYTRLVWGEKFVN